MPAGDWCFQPHGCSQYQMSPLPSWLGTGTPFCCRLCLTGPCPGCHLGKQQAGRERRRRQTNKCPLLSSSCPLCMCILPCCKELHSSSCPFLSLELHKQPQTQAHRGILGAVLCRARSSVVLPTQDILWLCISLHTLSSHLPWPHPAPGDQCAPRDCAPSRCANQSTAAQLLNSPFTPPRLRAGCRCWDDEQRLLPCCSRKFSSSQAPWASPVCQKSMP